MGSPHDYLERCDKLAVLGGTFDPIHIGHIAIAEAVLHQFKPRRVLFIPSGNPPHKKEMKKTAGEHRYQMVLSSICHNPGFDVSRLELNRTEESYTIDTIKNLREICPPNAEILFVIGADSLMGILDWKNAKELMTLCKFVAVPRPGFSNEKLNKHINMLQKDYKAQIYLLETPPLGISATDIRERFEKGAPVSGIMPRSAEDYARQYGLYGSINPDLGTKHFEWAKSRLKRRLSARRFTHTLGVVEESEKLAKHYGEDVNKARWAALLHDCTKEYSKDKKLALCHHWNIPLDPVLEMQIDIAHSLLSAESAKRDFYVNCPDIVQAIKYHTTGNKNMTTLDKITILADFIEPYREDYPPLEEMRSLAYTSMEKALVIGTKSTIDAVTAKGYPVHQWSSDALKELKSGKRN